MSFSQCVHEHLRAAARRTGRLLSLGFAQVEWHAVYSFSHSLFFTISLPFCKKRLGNRLVALGITEAFLSAYLPSCLCWLNPFQCSKWVPFSALLSPSSPTISPLFSSTSHITTPLNRMGFFVFGIQAWVAHNISLCVVWPLVYWYATTIMCSFEPRFKVVLVFARVGSWTRTLQPQIITLIKHQKNKIHTVILLEVWVVCCMSKISTRHLFIQFSFEINDIGIFSPPICYSASGNNPSSTSIIFIALL